MDILLAFCLAVSRRLRLAAHRVWIRMVIADLRRRGCVVGSNLWIGRGTRIHVAPASTILLGDDVVIGDECWIVTNQGDRMEIGNRCYFSTHCTVSGNVSIGRNSIFAAFVTILDSDHAHDRIDVPTIDQGAVRDPVVIGEDVWVGTGSVILRGANVGSHSIIGANAIATGSLGPYSVVLASARRVHSRLQS